MESSAFIARILSSLDPSNFMGGDQEDLTEFIANYLEQEEPPEIVISVVANIVSIPVASYTRVLHVHDIVLHCGNVHHKTDEFVHIGTIVDLEIDP